MLSFTERLRQEAKAAAAEPTDPWRYTLERVRGRIDFSDRLERISSQQLLDLLEIPQQKRTAGTFRRLSRLMVGLGWSPIRLRDFNGRYREQTRGFCRDPRDLQAIHRS